MSVVSRGDSYDNALAETVIGRYKAELVRRRGPWRGVEDLELATREWVDWFNNRRLMSTFGCVPTAEREAGWYGSTAAGDSNKGVSMKAEAVHLLQGVEDLPLEQLVTRLPVEALAVTLAAVI